MTTNDHFDPKAVEVLNATLLHVPFEGWSHSALMAGATDVGVDNRTLDMLFPNGAVGAISFYSRLIDHEMVAAFKALPEAPQKTHLAIRALILLRLELTKNNKDAVRRSLKVLALPGNAKLSASLLYKTVDTMWRAIGQRDTNFSFYTRRATLAAVYSSTVLAWLADNTGNMDKTISFLDRRLANVASIPRATAPFRGLMKVGEKFAGSLFKNLGRYHTR